MNAQRAVPVIDGLLVARDTRATSWTSRVKLPLIQCRRAAVLTPDQVADALLKQDLAWHHDPS